MKKAFKFGCIGLLALVSLIVIIASFVSCTGISKPLPAAGPSSTVATSSTTSTTAAPAPVQAAGPLSEFGKGTYEVGADIKPGKYKTAGPTHDDYMKMCYWSRNKNSSGDFGSIIANGTPQGPGVLTVNKGEVLEVSGTCTWKLSQ